MLTHTYEMYTSSNVVDIEELCLNSEKLTIYLNYSWVPLRPSFSVSFGAPPPESCDQNTRQQILHVLKK
jgi:hypothetical protein